jgi:hypothetical protein
MSKKAILTIDLAYESEKETNSQIIKEIQQDSQIPWCAKICDIEVYDGQ